MGYLKYHCYVIICRRAKRRPDSDSATKNLQGSTLKLLKIFKFPVLTFLTFDLTVTLKINIATKKLYFCTQEIVAHPFQA